MNSEIITDINYRDGRRGLSGRTGRRSRRKRSLPGGFLVVLAILLIAAGFALFIGWEKYGDLFRDRYDMKTRPEAVLRQEAPPAYLDAFAADLAVVRNAADDDGTVGAQGVFLCQEGVPDAFFAKHAFDHMNPASTTKILTCLLALENGDPDEVWTAGPEIKPDEPDASMAGFREGDRVTMLQVLYGLMLPSGADSANMIALHIGGSNEAFIEMMNRRAEEIGAVDTHFTNTHGLTDPEHYSSPYDLYLILREAMKNETFRAIAGCPQYKAEFLDAAGNPVTKNWKNTNYFLNGKASILDGFSVAGGKTGTTLAAGACLALAAGDSGGNLFYSIVLKSANHASLYPDVNAVLEKIPRQH